LEIDQMPKFLIFGTTALMLLGLMLVSYEDGRTSDVFFTGFLVMTAFTVAELSGRKR